MINKKIISIILALSILIQPIQQTAYADNDNAINNKRVEALTTLGDKVSATSEPSQSVEEIEKWAKSKMDKIADNYKNQEEIKNLWAIASLGKLGKQLNEKTLDYIYSQTINEDGNLIEATGKNLKNILALRASGIDVQNYYGHNLVDVLVKSKFESWEQAPAIWALNSDDYEADERINKEIESILSQRSDSGLWESEWGWADNTGFALYALAPYYNTRDDIKYVFEKAVDEISRRQLENGDITEKNGNNNSLVMVIGGLLSANPDYLKDERLIKNGNTLLHALKAYDIENTADFTWKIGDKKANPFSTEQSFRALVSYFSVKDNKGYVFDYRGTPKRVLEYEGLEKRYKLEVKGANRSGNYKAGTKISIKADEIPGKEFEKWTAEGIEIEDSKSKTITIIMPNNNVKIQANFKDISSGNPNTDEKFKIIFSIDKLTINKGYVVEESQVEFSQGESVWDITKKILDDRNIDYDSEFNSQYNSIYVKSIAGDGEFDHGLESGWMFTLNGKFTDKGANAIFPKKDDIVRWRYTTKFGKDIINNISDDNNVQENSNSSGGSSNKTQDKKESPVVSVENKKIKEELPKPDMDYKYSDQKDISSWSKEYILKAKSYGLMQGDKASKFNPKNKVNRAEIAVIISNFIGNVDYDKNSKMFEDIEDGRWYFDAVDKVTSLGILNGMSKDRFNPKANLTREQLAVIIVNMMKYDKSEIKTPKDLNNISSWARDAVSIVYARGIMQGDEESFNPKEEVSREMIAVVMVKLYEEKYEKSKQADLSK